MLEWNVIYENWNQKKIMPFNVFRHGSFLEDCKEISSKFKNKEEFTAHIRRSLAYYFWSKCEWEIIISCWPPNKKFDDSKWSVYDQVMMNWDRFIEYLWENKEKL